VGIPGFEWKHGLTRNGMEDGIWGLGSEAILAGYAHGPRLAEAIHIHWKPGSAEKVLDVGPIHATRDETRNVPLPP
jgi:hypothetical protein